MGQRFHDHEEVVSVVASPWPTVLAQGARGGSGEVATCLFLRNPGRALAWLPTRCSHGLFISVLLNQDLLPPCPQRWP